jgi:hypothetical protein
MLVFFITLPYLFYLVSTLYTFTIRYVSDSLYFLEVAQDRKISDRASSLTSLLGSLKIAITKNQCAPLVEKFNKLPTLYVLTTL